ncbi:hypothetical protein IW261DRAFT_969616 [Armillaria novae-zelandiae]|uniref:C3H1-type domain-containing protein n=1 Tax=Armillaria novae-zelandiae TaxID=153914 RepID=A0AA39PG46_9AGAR|nr:hypothetical protein IW261DRAFT_969616 [Armillaria novae-zelandiae]
MSRHIQCRYYRDDGTAIGRGCPRPSSCYFVHPSHPEWSSLPSVRRFDSSRRSTMPSPTTDPRRRPSMDSTGSSRRPRRSPSPVPGPSSRPERRHSTVSDTWVKSPPLSAASSSFPPPISATPTSFMSPPPPRTQSPPPPALVPIPPDPPKFGLKQSKLSNEELKKIWGQRMDIFSAHHRLRDSIMKRGQRINALQQVNNVVSSSNSAASLSKELERLKKEQDNETDQFKKLFNKIVECDSWPMAPRPEQGIIENKFNDMTKLVDDLTKNINHLNLSMTKGLSGPEETPAVTSRKRRRLSDGGLDDSTFNAAELQESVDSVENQIFDLQNLLLNRDNDIQTEVIGLMENRYDELEAARNAGTDPEALFRQSSSIRLHSIERQLTEVAVEMADVFNKETGKNVDHEQVKRQNAALVSDIHRLRAQVDTWEAREAESNRQIAALSAALHDYKTHPAVPPVSIAPEYIRPHIESIVLPDIRNTVQSMINNLRADLQQSMVDRENEIYGTVWDKLKLANDISETIVARMEAPPSASSVPVSK